MAGELLKKRADLPNRSTVTSANDLHLGGKPNRLPIVEEFNAIMTRLYDHIASTGDDSSLATADQTLTSTRLIILNGYTLSVMDGAVDMLHLDPVSNHAYLKGSATTYILVQGTLDLIALTVGNIVPLEARSTSISLGKGITFVLSGATSGTLTASVPSTVTSYSIVYPSAQGTGALVNDGAGALSWTPINLTMASVQATGFTAAAGMMYPVNTSGGIVTVTPPGSPTAGMRFGVTDSNRTWDTNNCRVGFNTAGTRFCSDTTVAANISITSQDTCIIFEYVNASVGWVIAAGKL